ncbi:MAG TPA: DUF485 domain-containing protein [Candidatus Yaniella excrementigallinarum]|nr:DUF485 domain-containing protein [Candidatus Yaniella excrementigallinarum]
MTDHDDPADEDFVLDLVREPQQRSQVPEAIRAMRARRVTVDMPTGVPSVQEVLLNPRGHAADAQPSQVTVRRLMRVQLRLGINLAAIFFGLVVVANVAFLFSPALAATTVAGIPLEWLFPAVVCIPLPIILGWFYVRRATENEQSIYAEPVEAQDVYQ